MNEAFFPLEMFKRRQMLLMTCLVGVLSFVVFALVWVIYSQGPNQASIGKSYQAPITSGSSRIDPKEVWVEKFTSDQDLNSRRMDQMEKMLESIIKLNQSSSQNEKSQDVSFVHPTLNTQSTVNIREEIKSGMMEDFIEKPSSLEKSGALSPAPIVSSSIKNRVHTKGIQHVSLNLLNGKGQRALKTYDNTIPAGAFAQAVLLGGVDASTNIQASSDPRPVLLRVTSLGTLPRKFHSDLIGCHALAACYGDMSSERVYMRLEKVTCTERKTGEIVEMTVSGYVAGEDGRAGLRGIVVDRAGASVRNAAIGGFLSGVGSFLTQSHNPVTYSLNSGLAQTNPLSNGELLKHGAAKGATTALEKYADFYIKRAEQMQPVIQVQAGRRVDMVFTQGVSFEDSAARRVLVKNNDQSRYANVQASDKAAPSSIEAWIPNQGDEK
jgi:conjugal transfer pilus assembly protein TraB